jgi:hypothetical protein
MAPARCRYTLRVMGIKSVVRLPRRWLGAAGVALVTALAVAGAYVEANPVHRYGGLHLTSRPPLAAYLLLAVPSVALIWRNSRPVEVLGLAVGGAVGWAALGQIDGAALVPVIVGVYWVAMTRARRIAVAAGLAGAVAILERSPAPVPRARVGVYFTTRMLNASDLSAPASRKNRKK